jgi:hypothetical protein
MKIGIAEHFLILPECLIIKRRKKNIQFPCSGWNGFVQQSFTIAAISLYM